MAKLYTVLGSNGNIGKLIVADLKRRGLAVRPIDRQQANLLDAAQTIDTLKGSSHAFVAIGLPYKTRVWQDQWPVIMRNIIAAAKKVGCKVIFFDNIYMYGPAPLKVPITEQHSQQPPSNMGKVRKQIADMLMHANKLGAIQATIARCADFYGPQASHGVLNMNVIDRMLTGKKPRWLGNPYVKHSFAYAPDAARATVVLGLSSNSYGKIWHLPVDAPAMTVKDIVNYINKKLGSNLSLSVPSPAMLSFIGLFAPMVKEAAGMSYQFDTDYVMSCDKFMKTHPEFRITSYKDGLANTLSEKRQLV